MDPMGYGTLGLEIRINPLEFLSLKHQNKVETDGSSSHDLAMKKLKLGKAPEGVGHPDFSASSGCFLVGYEGVLRGHGELEAY